MEKRHYFFAGGGTGGHIYPALAVCEQLKKIDPESVLTFLCTSREIDARILSKADVDFVPLPALPFSVNPLRFLKFIFKLLQSRDFCKTMLAPVAKNSVVIGVGGFASAPAVLAAKTLKIPIAVINVDSVPGRANKLLARYAREIFVQFEDTAKNFISSDSLIDAAGCPLRESFQSPDPQRALHKLNLQVDRKTILITGASSGAASINRAFCKLAPMLGTLENWQIVHITGVNNLNHVKKQYEQIDIPNCVIDYYDDMADLFAVSDLIIGRGGAVSVAEYAAAGKPVIIMPYPHHKDKHQYLNADKLVEAGAAVIVDDQPENIEKTAQELGNQLLILMSDNAHLEKMARAAKSIAKPDAAVKIAKRLKTFM
jgi:UDP-N-acetylglucosamine--N-acetylmuramyl-(pentapeptide) pyrophosphoryl-undecaprenol N-acetylglucosamine transferase